MNAVDGEYYHLVRMSLTQFLSPVPACAAISRERIKVQLMQMADPASIPQVTKSGIFLLNIAVIIHRAQHCSVTEGWIMGP